jgi:glutathione S-transferase
LDSEFVLDAVKQHKKLISWMVEDDPYLAGDTFTNADCAVIPYILRLELLKLKAMWKAEPAVADWWARMQSRPSVKAAIFERMEEPDWAPFKNLSPDPWPRVQMLLEAGE